MAYTSALLNVSLAGPTLFGPVISNAALIASHSLANSGRKYFVLLIITVRILIGIFRLFFHIHLRRFHILWFWLIRMIL
jgi:hypothetical protein